MITPREYQVDARQAIWDYFETRKGNPLVLMPTGTGKSVVIADFSRSALWAYPSTRIVVVTHVETLIQQNFAKMLEVWPSAPAGIYSAGLNRRDTHCQVTFAGIQSIHAKVDLFPWIDLVIVDEAHLISPNDETRYQAWLTAQKLRNPHLKVIGLTATDWRLGLGKLTGNGIFNDVAIDMTTPASWNYFVDEGYLSPLLSKKTRLRLEDDGIAVSGGEYVLGQQQKALDKDDLTRQAVEELISWGRAEARKCWMVFGTGIDHCVHIAEMLESYGVSAVPIHSKTKDSQAKLRAFQHGEFTAAVSMNKLTTGVDVPQIDLMGILRFTKSSSLWVQTLGRGTRCAYAPGYDLSNAAGRHAAIAAGPKPNGCRVCDFAHNTERLGPINNPVVSAPKGLKRSSGQGAPVRICPNCAEYVHASHRACTSCGHEFGVVLRIEGVSSSAEVMTRAEDQAPVVQRIPVDRVTYHYHKRRNSDKPPCLRVSYYSAGEIPQRFEEWISFEHAWARGRAANWWAERAPHGKFDEVPTTVEEALLQANTLRIPKRLLVWTNIQHPKVTGYEYD